MYRSTQWALAATLASSFVAIDVSATTVLIDFGRSDSVTAGSEAPSPYNIAAHPLNENNATTGDVPLIDTDTNATGWTINVTEDGNGNGGRAGSGADVFAYPAEVAGFNGDALKDSLFANGTAASMTVTISGLDDTKTYDLLLYGSRGNLQSTSQTWSLTQGTGGADVTHASGENSTTVVDWDGISTNGSGVIAFNLSGASNGALAINFGQIIEVPEPGSLALLGLGGLLVARRRRG